MYKNQLCTIYIGVSMNNKLKEYRQIAQEYIKALESVKEAKRKLTEVIIKYLIANSIDLSNCTELAISKNLGLPRSIVRSILSELVEKHILRVEGIGNIKPYVFTDCGIGGALDLLHISFTRKELHDLLETKESEKVKGAIYGVPLICDKINGRPVARYRGYAADLCLDTLVKRFLEFLEAYEVDLDKRKEKIVKAFGEKTLRELNLMLPELKAFEKLMQASWTPGLPSIFGIFPEMKNSLKEIDNLTPEEVKKVVIKRYEEMLKEALGKFKKFAFILEKLGYEGLHEYFKNKVPIYYRIDVPGEQPKYGFRDEYLWAATLALREGCKIAEKLGVDSSLIKEAKMLADILDIALEKKYRGIEVESMNLMEWGLKQLSCK